MATSKESVNNQWLTRRQNRAGATTTGLTHECGVFGAIGNARWPNNNEIAQLICVGLEALQHRGQESTGMAVSESTDDFHILKGMGLVKSVFNNENVGRLRGTLGIGHTRYATSAASAPINCQPFVVHSMHGSIAVAHNGELVNCASLRKMVLDRGVGLSTHSDSELITQALCLIPPEGEVNGPDWPARIRHLMQLAPLSYSLVLMLRDRIYAVRDPYGNRPLSLGRIVLSNGGACATPSQASNGGHLSSGTNGADDVTTVNGIINADDDDSSADGWVVSSESCAFLIGTRLMREVLPGEIVEMTHNGCRTVDIVARPAGKSLAFCIFEYVYFARPNSIFENQEVYAVRSHCGQQLAVEYPVDADMVGSVPESGNAAAYGYAKQSGIPLGELLTKNTYVGRTFIQPTNRLRQMNVALKFCPIQMNVKGKRIIMIDDSIVRGNTIGPIIKLLRRAGAKEVHVRVASPPLKYPCYMGINIPTREELIANTLELKLFAQKVGADSLEYLSVDGLIKAVQRNIDGKREIGHCTACLTGDYPGGIPEELDW